MRMHQVDVDDEVFSFVKEHAEPLVDTFNTALRKLLLTGNHKLDGQSGPPLKTNTPKEKNLRQSFPTGTPMALRHIIEVAKLVRCEKRNRVDAIKIVAKRYDVYPQTVLDKCCRQLGLNAMQFDQLVEKNDSLDLQMLLRRKFPRHINLIEMSLQSS